MANELRRGSRAELTHGPWLTVLKYLHQFTESRDIYVSQFFRSLLLENDALTPVQNPLRWWRTYSPMAAPQVTGRRRDSC